MLTTVKERLSACLVLTKISMNHSDRVLLAKSPQLPEDYSRQMQVTYCFSPHTKQNFFIFLTFIEHNPKQKKRVNLHQSLKPHT